MIPEIFLKNIQAMEDRMVKDKKIDKRENIQNGQT